jgi:UDP-2,3-diacylglucosamine hydrolase
MKISAISDVHIKSPNDQADELLCKFLDHPFVIESDYILLLGDIFDLMCGPHSQYLVEYRHIFDKLDLLLQKNKKIYFTEGNHDVHLEKLFFQRWPQRHIYLTQKPIVEIIDSKKVLFSHGDEYELENISYQRYKKFILSPPLKFVANNLMPYQVLKFIGERASQLSRKKGKRSFDEDKVKLKFRDGVEKIIKDNDIGFVIGGHSHVQDFFIFNEGKTIYLNNGFALKTQTFIGIENNLAQFIPLS